MFLSFPGLFCRRMPQSSLEFPFPARLLCFHKTLLVFWKEHFFPCHHQVAFPADKGKLQPGSYAHCSGGDVSRSAPLLPGEGRTQMVPPCPSSHVSVTSDLHEALEVRKYNLRNKFKPTYGCHILPHCQPFPERFPAPWSDQMHFLLTNLKTLGATKVPTPNYKTIQIEQDFL